jgi:hypothetical protein
MSDRHDLRPWYSRLPLTAMILAAPFAFVAMCGDQWLPEESTFATLAQHKQKPLLRVSQENGQTLLHATSWLSWPPLRFDRCDLQPVQKPRIGVCFHNKSGNATLVKANIEQLTQIGIVGTDEPHGRWISEGQRYLWGQTIIDTKPQLQVFTIPAPLKELELPAAQRPRFLTVSHDEFLTLWQDQRPQAGSGDHLLIARTQDGRLEAELTLQRPELLTQLRNPDVAPWLVRPLLRAQRAQEDEALRAQQEQQASEASVPDSELPE